MSAATSNERVAKPAPPLPRLSLRSRLVLLVLASVVPLILFSLGQEYQGYRADVATSGRQTLALARSMALVVEDELQTRIAALQALTVSRPLLAGDLDTFRDQAETVVAKQFPGANILLLREDGQQLVNTILPRGAPLPVRPNLESTRRVFATGKPAVSNLYQGAVGPRPVVAIDVPVEGPGGGVAYVLSLNPRLAVFAEMIDRQHLPANWVVSVFDRNGVNIARVPNGDKFVGHEASPSLLGHLMKDHESILETTSLEGISLLTVFSHADRFGWAVAIGVPRAELTGPALASAARTLAVGGVLLAIGLALALYAAQRIIRPIEALGGLAAASDRDVLLNPPATGLRETDEVAQALRSAEETRRQSERTATILRDGIDTMPEGFVIYDDEDRLVFCNQAYRDFYPENADLLVPGMRFEDILREGLSRGRFPVAKGREEAWIAERLQRQRASFGTIEQRLGDGRWVFVSKSRMANGYVAGLRVDITALKLAQQALDEREEQLKRAQRIAHMGSDLRDLRTDDAEWSDETYRIFGVSKETFIPSTENFLQMVHPDDRATVLATRAQIRQGICPQPFEYRIVRPDGTVRQVYRENELIRDETGTPTHLIGTSHDVTEQRNTEQQLRQAQKMEAIGNLTGGMAHDFNNLLGAVIGNLDLLRSLPLGEEADELVREAIDASLLGADLTRRLLAFARRQPLQPRRVELNDLVAGMATLLRRTLGEDIAVSVDLAADVAAVVVDASQLESAIVNLATNARDAMPSGGRLMIATENRHLDADYAAQHAELDPGDYVMIEISDTGTGIPPEVITRVFEPFFTTKEPGRGTGLGLSMVFGFVKQSGGHINVYSEPGRGTTFRIYLRQAVDEALVAPAVETTPPPAGGRETILVVEDNPTMRRVVRRQLAALGYQVLEAERADAALAILAEQKVDLLFSDIVMPGDLNGIALAKQAVAQRPELKVVLTSGFPEARLNGNSGAITGLRLLSKPYRRDELARVLREALDGSG